MIKNPVSLGLYVPFHVQNRISKNIQKLKWLNKLICSIYEEHKETGNMGNMAKQVIWGEREYGDHGERGNMGNMGKQGI